MPLIRPRHVPRWLAAGAAGALACLSGLAPAATLYVWQESPIPTPPYTNWATAANDIQQAVDAAHAGDTVLVTNGVYAEGGRVVFGTLTNRVTVDKPLTVRSVNGPAVTLIQGYQVPGTTQGAGAVRCVYLVDGAVLSGFTLTNGQTGTNRDLGTTEVRGGGAWCEPSAVMSNCTVTGNVSFGDGGGVYRGRLFRCTLTGNESAEDGGAVDHGTLYSCTVTGNSSRKGGAADNSTLHGCVLTGNKASREGGAVRESTLYNCTLTDNSARRGGGAYSSTLYNCIVYHNRAPVDSNYFLTTLSYSCTTPLPSGGVGNITKDPHLASSSHLSAASPCLGAGSATYASEVDIDGQPWATPPSMGADELVPGRATGVLSVVVEADYTNIAVGFVASFRAHVEGQTTATLWSVGDETLASNALEVVHAWGTPATNLLQLTAFNDDHVDGVSATVQVQVVAVPKFYVNRANSNPVFPYTNWATASRSIQKAIGASQVAGRRVLVTNGVYDAGGVAMWGLMTNRVALTSAVVVRSVNGPAVTIIQGTPSSGGGNGDGAIRCAYVGRACILSGFTLTNGHTLTTGHPSREQGGGGAWCERNGVVTNCTLVGNAAFRDGGGANGGLFYRCTFVGNVASDDSGGADDAALYDCTLRGNSASGIGGGASESALFRCTLAGNSAAGFGGGAALCTLSDSMLRSNRARLGGGASDGVLVHCVLSNNSASVLGGGATGCQLCESVLSANSAANGAGGAYYCTIYRSFLIGNSTAHAGGGSYGGTLYNCILSGNWVTDYGGGAFNSELLNCTLVGNSATNSGGGAWGGLFQNCIAYHNAAPDGPNHAYVVLASTCTTPLPANVGGNITNAPRFVDLTGGNLRLQSNSPCINAGHNAYAPATTDLDGLPRIAGGTVDIGAYEFQSPASVISYAWLQHYGLPTDGSVDFIDLDGDCPNTWQEWQADTDPTNALSALRIESISPGPPVTMQFTSSSNRLYTLRYATNVTDASWADLVGQIDVPGSGGLMTLRDTNAAPPRFYRVGVSVP